MPDKEDLYDSAIGVKVIARRIQQHIGQHLRAEPASARPGSQTAFAPSHDTSIDGIVRRQSYLRADSLQQIHHAVRSTNEHLEDGLNEHKYWRYEARPRWRWLVFGALGIALLFGQVLLPRLDDLLGGPLTGGIPYLRLFSMLAGAYCIFYAWPRYRHHGISDEEEEQRRKMKAEFSRKFRR